MTAQFVAAELEKLTAGDIDTDRLYAAAAHIVSLAAGSIAAGSVTADRLSAALARFVSVYAQTGEFDFATVENLVSGALSLQQGAMETVYIKNLAVTQANLLSATLGKLVLKGDDGGYWRIFVGSDGTISAEKASEAGGLPPGGQVVEAGMNVGSLNASSIQASAAVINSILTTALQAGSITAADALIASATIPELYTTTIRAIGESLELVAGRKNIIHRGETPPADAGAGDLWVQPSTGALFQMAAGGAGLPEFAIDEDGMLYYSYGEGRTVYQLTLDESGDLYVDEAAPFAIAIGPEGQIIPWERVKDGELQAGIDRNTADIGENKTAIGENTALIRQQSAKITEMADAIDLRVTTEVYEQGVDALGQRIQKNEASITLLDKSITSKVSQEVYDQDIGAVREDVTAIRQTAKDIRLEVSKKSATFRQSSAPTEYAEGDIWIDTDDSKAYIATASGWASWKPSELKTSFIEIAQDHIDVSTGGSLNVDSGAAHFRTKEYTLSILADDDSEETVMDFDAESKTLRVTEIAAGNARPYIAGITEVTSSQIGGLDGLAGLLAKNQYEHIVYTQETDDYSSALIEIRGSNSIVVEIIANTPTRVPSLRFYGITGNVLLRNLKWEMYSKDSAFVADSGVITMLNCYINAQYGILAEYGARVNWIGDDNTMTSAGKCTSAMAIANTCADIKLFGLIPSGYHLTYNGGTITSISTETGESIDDGIVEYTTETIEAEVGYYGTKNGWKSGQLYQGYSGGKGRIYGCMRFDLPSGAGNIQSAVLGLHRYKDAGKGSEVDVTLYGSAAAFGSQPSLGTKYLERADAAAPDATVSFDVTEAVRALANGTIKQLVLYTGETTVRSGKVYSSNYAMFDRAALKITY